MPKQPTTSEEVGVGVIGEPWYFTLIFLRVSVIRNALVNIPDQKRRYKNLCVRGYFRVRVYSCFVLLWFVPVSVVL